MTELLFALWFFLPAGLANAVPVFAARLEGMRRWNTPMDSGKTFRGKRIFGDNKTWRGILAGILTACLTVAAQHWLAVNTSYIGFISGTVDYFSADILWLGPLLGIGALAGDALESFVKRQLGVDPGGSWFPFDQIDYIIGGLLLSLLFVRLELATYAVIFITWFLLHLLSVYLGYLLRIRSRPI
jgi:CDP-2,3-bis-(O-geranylgeranyl)-sn-glycerol synthase